MKPKILAFSGSSRRESFNKRLIAIAAKGAVEAGAEVTIIDLLDYPLPLFNEDLEKEAGEPESASQLKKLFLSHHGLLLACPEYNSSITPLLKNTIDWVSRASQGEAPLAAYRGKVATIMSASPGALGGLRGLVHVRAILGNIGVLVLPEQLAVSRAHEALDTAGSLHDSKQAAAVSALGAGLANFLKKHVGE